MTIEVEAPGGVIVEFPDGTAPDVMTKAMQAQFGGPKLAAPVRSPEADIGAGIVGGAARGAIGLAGIPGDLKKGADYVMDGSTKFVDPLIERVMGMKPGEMAQRRATGPKPGETIGANLSGPPSSADITGAVESMTGKLPHAQTTAGQYAQTAAEFAPGAMALGGAGSARDALLNIIFPAVGSETAGQLTKGTAAEPYARFAGGLIPNLASGIGRNLESSDARIVQSATRGTTPAQWDEAQRIAELGAGPVGVALSGPEAVSQAAGGSKLTDVLRTVEGSTHGGAVTTPFFAQRPAQVEGAVGRTLDQIAPQDPRPSTLGPRAATGAQQALDDVEQGINAATGPAYKAAEQHVLTPADYAPIAADPAFQASLRRLRSDEVLGPTYAQQPDNSVAVIDAVTKDMRARGVALGNAANPGFQPQAAGIYGRGSAEARDIARDPARGGVQQYDDALTAQEQARRQNLEPLQQGPLGRLAQAKDTTGAIEALLPSVPQAGGHHEIQDAVARLVLQSAERDPGLPAGLVRQGLANSFDRAQQDLISGRNQASGVKFRNDVVGTPEKQASLSAAVSALPSGEPAQRSLADLFTVLAATGQRKAMGSPTAFNAETLHDLSVAPIGAQIAMAPATAGTSVLSGIKDRMRRAYLERNASALANMFIAPDSVQQLRIMSERQLGSPILDAIVRSAAQMPAEFRAR